MNLVETEFDQNIIEDVLYAEINPNKAVGPDGLDGHFFKKYGEWSQFMREQAAPAIAEWLRTAEFPAYLNDARLIPFAKGTSSCTTPDRIRPVMVRNWLSKATEKCIQRFILEWGQKMFYTASYQAGFKADHGTQEHIAAVLEHVNKHPNKLFLFIDFSSAFDRVPRNSIR